MATREEEEARVILLPATQRDGDVTRRMLAQNRIHCVVCSNLSDTTVAVKCGVGALLLTEDAFGESGIAALLDVFEMQPDWSDIPVVVLMQGAGGSPAASRVLQTLRNVTLLERPAAMRSVLSAIEAALRARQRQYQIRDQLETIRRAEAKARELQEQLEKLLRSEHEARLDAERSNRMKDEFLATVSHELRTPLSAIVGWSQLLSRGGKADPAILEEGLAVIDRNARAQTQLIEDLLDMSRIISGKIRLEVQTVHPTSFIDAAIETVQHAADSKKITIGKVLDTEAGPILGDSNRLQQVIWNLLSNSIKFTPRGGTVQVILERAGSHIEISVADTGQGIRADFLPHVFERFRQADATAARKHGGLGLGLAIVKQLVELHGGSVRATSAGEGKGSTFTVRLPLAIVQRASAPSGMNDSSRTTSMKESDECASLKGLTLLVVDDEADSRNLVKRILSECHADVITAGSAAEALPLIESRRPDVLISDIGMPEVDGYEFIRQVRALGAERGGTVPAIALTAFARSQDRTKALLAGFKVHVAKPVDPDELIATIASVGGLTDSTK